MTAEDVADDPDRIQIHAIQKKNRIIVQKMFRSG